MYVCLCRAVNSTTVEAAIRAGAQSVETVGDHCGAGTVCGKCRNTIERLLDRGHVVVEPRSNRGR